MSNKQLQYQYQSINRVVVVESVMKTVFIMVIKIEPY